MLVRWFEVMKYSLEFGVIGVIPDFFPSRLSYLRAKRWPAVENDLSPVTDPISFLLACSKLRYFLLADVTGYCRLKTYFLIGIVLKVTMMGGRYLYISGKRGGKNVSWRNFSTTADVYPMYLFMSFKNINFDWIAQTTTA